MAINWKDILPILPAKAQFGDACNGCGHCCLTEPCPAARHLIDVHFGPCPALEFKDGRTLCGLLTNPRGYIMDVDRALEILRFLKAYHGWEADTLEELLKTSLDVGRGCDAIRRAGGPDGDIPVLASDREKTELFEARVAARGQK